MMTARRDFLGHCGRFAVVTPPTITLLLSTSLNSSAIALSSGRRSGDPTVDPEGHGDQNFDFSSHDSSNSNSNNGSSHSGGSNGGGGDNGDQGGSKGHGHMYSDSGSGGHGGHDNSGLGGDENEGRHHGGH